MSVQELVKIVKKRFKVGQIKEDIALSFTVELLPLALLSNNAGEAIAGLGADIHQLPQSGVAGHGVSQPWPG